MKSKTKILKFIKNNKTGIIGICGMVIAEIAFMHAGYNDGRRDGYSQGATDVMSDINDMEDDTYDNVKEYLVNNKGWEITNESK